MEGTLTAPRGILRRSAGERAFELARYLPTPDLARFVEFYWMVTWNLHGHTPYAQEVLPHPCVHLVFERNNSQVYGVTTGKFTRSLRDDGCVFAVKFTPGGFFPFAGCAISQLTDTAVLAEAIFGADVTSLEKTILARSDGGEMVPLIEDFLLERLPGGDDPHIALVQQIVANIAAQRDLTTVDAIAAQFSMHKRTLQRLFRQYVGVSPKWVIRRYRLQEIAMRLDEGEALDWANVAAELGYSDQTHLIKDFKSIVGATPSEYARSVATSGVSNT